MGSGVGIIITPITDGETGTERLSTFSKVTQLESGEAQDLLIQAGWL